MRFATLSALAPLSLIATLFVSACGSSTETTGSGGSPEAGDGKVHPAGNGMHESEAAACTALSNAEDAQNLAMSCTSTTRPCPSLIQVQVGGTACLEYDQGSVQGCIDYYAMQKTCDALSTAIADCVVTAFADSAPAGCP